MYTLKLVFFFKLNKYPIKWNLLGIYKSQFNVDLLIHRMETNQFY